MILNRTHCENVNKIDRVIPLVSYLAYDKVARVSSPVMCL